MILRVHVDGAPSHDLGDEIWHESLTDAIRAEAETIVDVAWCNQPESPDQAQRDAFRDRIIASMTTVLTSIGDCYQAPDGVLYSLIDEPGLDPSACEGRLSFMSPRISEPVVEEIVRFEDLPLEAPGTRRAIVRWSDGTETAAMTWYDDEILVCEGDFIGKTPTQIRSLHFRRDRDWLQS